jgi:Tol biopolymer transport system component
MNLLSRHAGRPRRRFRRLIPLSSGLTLVAALLGSQQAVAVSPIEPVGLIAFSRTVAGNSEIYSIAPDGSGLTQLTTRPAVDRYPSWSPDGTHLVFASNATGHFNLWEVNANGSGLVQLTTGSVSDDQPAWSPDGSSIAFVSDRSGFREIWLLSLMTGALTQLTHDSAKDGFPTWHPEGFGIVYQGTKSGTNDLWIVGLSGGTSSLLYGSPAQETRPAFSPDGRTIAFASNQSGSHEIWTFTLASRTAARLTPGPSDGSPSWSPYGGAFVFVRTPSAGTSQLVEADSTGGRQTDLSSGLLDRRPEWQPLVPVARAADQLTQSSLLEALWAAHIYYATYGSGSYSGISSLYLMTIDPDQNYMYAASTIASPGISVSSSSSGDAFGAARMSADGTCFFMKDVGATTTTYGISFAVCTGVAAVNATLSTKGWPA